MREIKFRAWDYSKKIFLPTKTYAILSVTEFGATGVMLTDFEEYREGEYFYPHSQIINQYTGLKDKKNKEIYEGDLVKGWFYGQLGQPIKGTFTIVWNKSWASFGVEHEASFVTIGNANIEVIGNIYQNPELLNNAL